MQRHTLARIVLLCLSSAACSAGALGQGFGFGVHANVTSSNFPGPTVDSTNQQIGSAYGAGWGGGVHLDAHLAVLSFRLTGDYIHYAIDENKFRDAFRPLFGSAADQMSISGGGLSIYTLAINGKMRVLPLPLVTPYITGGIGVAWISRDEATTSLTGYPGRTFASTSQSGKTSLDLGAGVDVKLGLMLFLEVKYAWILTQGTNSTYVPVTIGVTF
ncbi:MAG TPA: outer membrane beta-barrel protein [Bacteroidota bacterium]|nr:outer membrane beta-barrel protein [Bacteroidota bacterium]